MADPVTPDPMGYSPNQTPGQAAPQAQSGIDISTVQPQNFATQTFKSAGDAINNYKMGVLQSTAQGGKAQADAFTQTHQQMVDARTQALNTAAQRAGAVFGMPSGPGAAPGTEFSELAKQRAEQTGNMGLRVSTAMAHQADFKDAAKQRDMAFGNYMKEVNAAIPLAQAAAYSKALKAQQSASSTSMENKYNTLVGSAQSQLQADTAARQPIDQQLQAIDKQIANLGLAQTTNEQLLGEMAGAKKAGITGTQGTGLLGMGKTADKTTTGATYDPNRFQRLSDANTKVKNQIAQLQQQRSQLDASVPQPKGLADYVQGLAQQSGDTTLLGKASLGLPALVSGQQGLAKESAPADVTRLMSLVPGLKIQDAQAMAGDPDYTSARNDAQAGLTAATDDRGRIPGTTMTPWEVLNANLDRHITNPDMRAAIIKEFEPQYTAAGRTTQRTSKQQKARK